MYFLSRERNRDTLLSRILDGLVSLSPTYLFGGVIRDIALFGNRVPFRSDVDIVCDAQEQLLRDFLKAYSDGCSLGRNKYGGFRIRTDFWSVDIWSAETTWAFRRGLRAYEGIQSLLDTTITNWESILFPLRGGSLICRKGYFTDIRGGLLDIVLRENPNPLGMYVKVIRSYAGKGATQVTGGVVDLLCEAAAEYSFEELQLYERSHYRDYHVNRSVYDKIGKLENLGVAEPLNIGRVNVTLPLFPVLESR